MDKKPRPSTYDKKFITLRKRLLQGEEDMLTNRIMKHENENREQFAQNRIKITKLENEVNELKFCGYALMLLNTMFLLIIAFS
tara:strand:- start:104 stop:352 length:249 start_codon:yes stop_codon:yes gene_type:complete